MRANGGLWAVVGVFLAMGCDTGPDGRADAPFMPPEGKADDPVSAIEAFDFGALARDLVSQANEPLDPEAPGAGGPTDDPGGAPDGEPDGGADPDDAPDDTPEPGDTCTGFECADGSCIDASWECDGVDDCASAEDEVNCQPEPEGCDGFACGYGSCIAAGWVCDGILDCTDASDEASCGVAQRDLDLTGQRAPARLDASCVFTMTVGGGAAGAAAGEVISKACVGGGVVVGITTSATGAGAVGGFGAAAICGVADISQVDAIAGGLAGAVTGLIGGVTFC